MRPTSLSMRLGLSVSVMGAALVVLLAALAYFALTHELDSLAKKSLDGKLEQIRHSLAEDMSAHAISQQPHALLDLVMGHDNLHLTIYENKSGIKLLLNLGERSLEPMLSSIPATDTTSYQRWSDSEGKNFLTASKVMQLNDGDIVRVLLSIDRSADEALLSAYLKSTLILLPFLLALIGMGAWRIVKRGLSPLRQFRQVASLISTQDLTHRISVDKLPQELSTLAHGINFMLHRLDSGVQQLSQFSDDLAHELRSPISNLMGKAQVTLSRERPPEEYKAVLECCTEELERVTRIVTDMLFLAQVSHPASLVPFEKIILEDEVRRVVDLFSISAEEKQINLRIAGGGRTFGDRLMVQRAISNLLSNAIRHSPIGANISLLVERHSETVCVSVGNPGVGIPAQHIPHLFERFYRVDTSRSRAEGGTGLGLAIVRSIMSLHQGAVEVSSIPGSFTVFRLIFPKVPDGSP
ncbi:MULTISPECIES: heavy metal sensor histidine kinase [Pseudomonas]|uniref:Sensor protein n=1 Tax=Pseudomonas marincola TaxID=437900 RepID=A0A653E3W9_9PSED|nr:MULTISPECIES: heavy metal sensor histidine kinase [Pseudomonas]MBQ55662.1 two-component sensor histidine kinase [Pseudomonadaceae bacterium]OEO25772.1 two-component sensor histidine kinase [Pseudomonas sp. J237]CAE6952699.1 Sensor protein [Pseudomonas marincola]HCP53688.1 HAMP domain-containing protein [Pseudomonas sp.]